MHQPPFVVGKPVTGEYFVDRESELERLLALVAGVEKGGFSNSVLVGLRRTGKTSILENLAVKLKPNPRIVPMTVNCYGVAAKSRFAKMLVDMAVISYAQKTGDKAYLKRLVKATKEKARAALKRISEAKFSEFSVKIRDREVEEDSLIEDALGYVESLANEKNVFFIIMLDEFQDIVRWGDDTLKRIRTVVQGQKRVCYILSGSAITIMRDLVYDRRSPFYRQLVEIPVKKLEEKTIKEFLKKRFTSARMRINTSQIEKMITYCDGYPDYVQRLGLALYLALGPGGSITEEEIDRAYGDMILSLDGEFENYFAIFSPLEREILVALATGRIQPSGIAREVRKPIFNISKTLATLMNYMIIERPMKGQYRITDPVFADWLNNRFKPIPEQS
ncbi:MAG: ATP-binding protein [Thaumarchaeota archaeon]|nr:ATP-binding protein [Nitrososphaerota archaeon]